MERITRSHMVTTKVRRAVTATQRVHGWRIVMRPLDIEAIAAKYAEVSRRISSREPTAVSLSGRRRLVDSTATRSLRRRYSVGGGGAPVNFDRRLRRAADPKKSAAAARRGRCHSLLS